MLNNLFWDNIFCTKSTKKKYVLLAAFFSVFLLSTPSESADVIVVGDTRLKPVIEILSGINETLDFPVKAYSPSAVKGRLKDIAAEEGVRVVIALGRDAMDEALQLPTSIPVIYDLVVSPSSVSRPNTTGFYMGTPVKEYVELIRSYLRPIRRIAVVGSRELLNVLDATVYPQVASYNVKTPYEFVNTLEHLESVDAIVLLPDVFLLTATAMEEAYLISFKKRVPLIGLSEKHVKQGALLALVFDPVNVGRYIGEKAASAIISSDLGQYPPFPPRKFELFINMDTARKMGISIPVELVKKAKKIYP